MSYRASRGDPLHAYVRDARPYFYRSEPCFRPGTEPTHLRHYAGNELVLNRLAYASVSLIAHQACIYTVLSSYNVVVSLPVVVTTTLAMLSRRYRYSPIPMRFVGKGCGRAVRQTARSVRGDVSYVDINGFVRCADLTDELEVQSFIGGGKLPTRIAHWVKPGDSVVDVGANIGIVTSQLCRLVGQHGLVWAIEPVPRNVRRLEQLATSNNLTQLRLVRGGLANFTGTADLHLPTGGESGWASYAKSWDVSGSLRTPVWRLDDLIGQVSPPSTLSFVKIDVEGYELQVLEGASRTLSALRPLVLCEFNDILLRGAGSSSLELLAAFANLGYRPFREFRLSATDLHLANHDLLLAPETHETKRS